ncbi:MAG: hypothetical protein OZ922_00695 [Myxococcales bacterium]|jgi:hypothetical protein|nr:hypothetical protein [Myxococcales bacterium]
MRRHIRRAGKISLGVLLLALGVIGLMLPLVPQIPFLIGGLTLLSSENRHCKALLESIEKRVGWRRSSPREAQPMKPTEADDARR